MKRAPAASLLKRVGTGITQPRALGWSGHWWQAPKMSCCCCCFFFYFTTGGVILSLVTRRGIISKQLTVTWCGYSAGGLMQEDLEAADRLASLQQHPTSSFCLSESWICFRALFLLKDVEQSVFRRIVAQFVAIQLKWCLFSTWNTQILFFYAVRIPKYSKADKRVLQENLIQMLLVSVHVLCWPCLPDRTVWIFRVTVKSIER